MDAGTLVGKIEKRFTLDDVTNEQVETVSVVALDELETMIRKTIDEETAQLKLELQKAKEQLANATDTEGDGGGGGDLERVAAEAAIEAEERALEAKAAAEQRAAEAEAKVTTLEAKLATAEGAPKEDPAKVKELEGKVAALQAQADKAAELQKEIDKLKEAEEDDEDDGPVTDGDKKKALRLATAFLEDVFSDDEEETNKALKAGTFRETFAKELTAAHRKFVKRVRAVVRADGDMWEDVLKECEGKEW